MLKHYLLERYRVDEAYCAEEGLDKINENNYDLIITDVFMGGMTGIELIAHLQKQPEYQKIPVLILSSSINQRVIKAAKKAGAHAWLAKPFDPGTLYGVIDNLLSKEGQGA